LLSAAAALRTRTDAERQRAEAAHSINEAWVNQGEKNAHSAAHYGTWAFKPSTPLSAVDPGIEPYAGTATFLEAHRRNEIRYRPAAAGTSAQRFGSWSAAAVLQVLVPLLVIMVAFPAFAGEREQGTLRQLASLGVPMRRVAAGKALGVGGALAVVLVPITLIGVVAVEPDRVLALSAVYLTYFVVVLAIALTVSARAPSARTALVVLLGLWTFGTLAVPRAAADVARYTNPTPSSFAFAESIATDLRQVSDGHGPSSAISQLAERRKSTGRVLQDGEEATSVVFDYHYDRLHQTYSAQGRIHALASLVSPMMAVRALSMAIAGTDLEQHVRFAAAAETHRRTMLGTLNGTLAAQQEAGLPQLSGEALWRSIPQFAYEPATLAAALAPHGLSAAILVLWLGVASLLFWSLRKVHVG
jgi:ABC-2 type transport system permease protein